MNIIKNIDENFQLDLVNKIKIFAKENNNLRKSVGYLKYTENNSLNNSFMIEDLKGFLKYLYPSDYKNINIMEINSIFIDEKWRNKEIGSRILKSLCEEYSKNNDPCIIITSAYVHTEEYNEKDCDTLDTDSLNQILDKVAKFLEKCGFINTNPVFGTYEYKISYIYVNEAAKKYIFNNDTYKKVYEENVVKLRSMNIKNDNKEG